MMLELIIGFLTFLLVLDYFHKRKREAAFKKAGIKCPRAWPVLGNATMAIGNSTSRIFELLADLKREYGKVARLWLFSECVLIVQDAKYFEGILSSQLLIRKNMLYNLLSSWLGDGLLLSATGKWHARRKIITPSYHFKILEQFVEIFDQQSEVMVRRLRPKADGETALNMFPIVCLTALDIIAETAMGVKINAQENPNFSYAKAVTDVADIIANRFMKPVLRFDFMFRILEYRKYCLMRDSIEIMHNFTDKVIQERREALENSLKNGTLQGTYMTITADDLGIKKRMAFLDVLLQSTVAGKRLNNEDIREEVDTFMFEGHDTTTSGISHTLYLLARHPQEQQKVFEEILQVIGRDKTKTINMRELQDLRYLDAVIKESLRLYPPVPMIGRVTEQEVVIDGKTIPANVNIVLLIYAVCRDPDCFAQPDDFRPVRFLNAATDHVNPFAYVPFSAGPRNCIGQKFAILEMKSTISKMIRHYELLPLGAEVVPVMNLILRSGSGINMGLRPRVY